MKRWLTGALAAALALGVVACRQTPADDKKGPEAFTEADKAGPDFAVQGEYAGDAGKDKFGAQVIARGDGKFEIFFLKGGLPGDGWDAKTRLHADAKTADGKTTFAGSDWKGDIAGSKLTGKTKEGEEVNLKHVVRESKTQGEKPPKDALVLFDGKNLDHWVYRANKKPAEWTLIDGGAVQVKGGDVVSKEPLGSFTAHAEFRLPFMPTKTGQERANSGFYLQDRWEVQILDSFGLTGEDNECGGIYSQVKPSVNMCYPPLSWQTYDVEFTAAKYDGAKKTDDAVATIKHNGVLIQDHVKLSKGATDPSAPPESADPQPIRLQDHGNPMQFRNIWVVEKK
jgi:hypothetical protein